MRRLTTDIALVIGVLVLAAGAYLLGTARSHGADGELFGGTDAAVTELLQEQGHEPRSAPMPGLASGEVESGLFAVQAALGAGVLGYCLGVLRGRRASPRAARDDGDGTRQE